MSDRDPVTGEHTPMDAGAWRKRALRESRRVDHLMALATDTIAERDRLRTEVADLRAEREALYAVVRAARVACDSVWAKDHVPLAVALDALPCWCGKPDDRHMSGCARGLGAEVKDGC